MSPTQLSLRLLREQGWLVAVVEKWNPYAKIRQDLFGFIDIIAIKGDTVMAVQATTEANMAARLKKIASLDSAAIWKCSTRTIEVHGWSKRGERGKRKTWKCSIRYARLRSDND